MCPSQCPRVCLSSSFMARGDCICPSLLLKDNPILSCQLQMSASTVNIPSHKVGLNSQNAGYELKIIDNKTYDFPKKHDLLSISLSNIPDTLDRLELHIGGRKIFEFKVADIQANKNILSTYLPLSKASYMVQNLIFYFNNDYLEEHQTFQWVDEFKTEEHYSDTKIQVFDGRDYFTGYEVYTTTVPTGNKIKQISKDVECIIPEIKFEMIENNQDLESLHKTLTIPIWQKIMIFPEYDDQTYIDRLVNKYEMTILDKNHTIKERMLNGEPFLCQIKNSLRFTDGYAAFCYSFDNIV